MKGVCRGANPIPHIDKVVVIVNLLEDKIKETLFVGLDRSRIETAKSKNLKILFEIIKEKFPAQPTAKLNRQATITKHWKVVAELRQTACFDKSNCMKKPPQLNSIPKQNEKEIEERIKFRD